MPLRDWVNKVFAKPKELPQRRHDDAGNMAAAARDKAERETAAAIGAKQAELLRTHLTPERTPFGTEPKRPMSGDEARARAEQLVTPRDEEERDQTAGRDKEATRGPPGAGKAFATRADTTRRDKEADAKADGDRPAIEDGKADAVSTQQLDDPAPLEPETITAAYVERIVILQAGHDAQANEERDISSWTREERDAAVAALVAEIEAQEASAALTHSTGGGKTM